MSPRPPIAAATLMIGIAILAGCSTKEVWQLDAYYPPQRDVPPTSRLVEKLETYLPHYADGRDPHRIYTINGHYLVLTVPFGKSDEIARTLPYVVCIDGYKGDHLKVRRLRPPDQRPAPPPEDP